jgi:hypothetical protein
MGDLLAEFQEWPLLVGILVIGGLPCLSEELWCRAYLGRGLVGRQGLVLGVILTSILFGVIHGHPHQGAMAAVMGICLHYAYLTSRSLMIPMLIHFLNNSLAVTSHRWAKFFGDKLAKAELDPETIPPQIFAAAFLLVMAVAWALYASRARLVQKEGSDKPLWQPSYPGVALPPPGSNTYVASSWPGWLPSLTVLLGIAILGISLYLN